MRTVRRSFRARTALTAATLLAALCLPAASAHADLSVYPKRVVFEGRTRSAAVTLVNNDSETHRYRIAWQILRMNGDGKLVRAEGDIDDLDLADDMIRYAPRQVTVPPGTAQTVRLMLRKPAGLEAGEYRSHLLFLREPKTLHMGSEQDDLAISLNVLYGLSIPVFVRNGELDVKVDIGRVEVERSEHAVHLDVHFRRSGDMSAYGDVTVSRIDGDEEHPLKTVRGVGLYRETDERTLGLDLTTADGSALAPGTFRVVYRAPAEHGHAMLAETTVAVP